MSTALRTVPWLIGWCIALQSHALELSPVFPLGVAAPGFSTGEVVVRLGDRPRIDAAGNVSIVALVRRPDGAMLQTLYRVTSDGATTLLFRTGDAAPGDGRTFSGFPLFFPSAPSIAGGRISFLGSLATVDGASLDGVWSERSGSFERLFLSSDALPDIPPGAPIQGFSFALRGTTLLLRAAYAGGGAFAREDEGVWRNADGAWRTVIAKGQPAPGIPGAVFDGATPLGTIFFFTAKEDARVLVQAFAAGASVTAENDEGLWIETANGLQLLVREGASAPLPSSGKRRPPRATFGPTTSGGSPTFGGDNENLTPAINASGRIVFGAVVRSKDGRSNSVWTNRSGALELIALGTIGLVGSGAGAQAPGFPAGVTFGTFQLSRINGAGRIGFLGAAATGNFNFTEALWWDAPGALQLVAAVGREAPGTNGAMYADITLVDRLTDQGTWAFEAALAGAGVSTSNDRAVFRASTSGAQQIRLRKGDVAQTPSGPRVVRDFSWGEGATLAGRAVAEVTFTDGGAGVFTFQL